MIPHEIGHVLTNAGHTNDFPWATLPLFITQPNLMYSEIWPGPDRVLASRRLTAAQQARMYAERTKIALDYVPYA